jgi:hypothetical protein
LVDGTRIGLRELGLNDGIGLVAKFQGGVGLWVLGPCCLLNCWLLVVAWLRSFHD